jgi:thiamine-monophosphate kinase
MDVRDLGEFGVIDRLRDVLGVSYESRLIVPIGDDAAVWHAGDTYMIATTDTMVAGVHFIPRAVPWGDVGWKSLAANVSDVAAMGGTPSFALVTLCLPPDTPVTAVDGIYQGLRECGREYGAVIAGGDVVSSSVFMITVAMFGEAERNADGSPALLRRDAAKPGDAIAVTGSLGAAAGGLRALQGDAPSGAARDALSRRHSRPRPRIDAGLAAVRAGLTCGMDISDGLVQDLGHICRASGAGAELLADSVPVDSVLTDAYPDDARAMALAGGEDYELILLGDEESLSRVGQALGPPLKIVGRMVEGDPAVRVLDADGAEVQLPRAGWDHLRDGSDA